MNIEEGLIQKIEEFHKTTCGKESAPLHITYSPVELWVASYALLEAKEASLLGVLNSLWYKIVAKAHQDRDQHIAQGRKVDEALQKFNG